MGILYGLLFVYIIIAALITALLIISQWKIYTKAGKPGWAVLIPIYNTIVLLEIVKKEWWWIFLLLIPVVNIVILIIIYIELAKVFDKPGSFAIGLLLLPCIFFPILGFGRAEYKG